MFLLASSAGDGGGVALLVGHFNLNRVGGQSLVVSDVLRPVSGLTIGGSHSSGTLSRLWYAE